LPGLKDDPRCRESQPLCSAGQYVLIGEDDWNVADIVWSYLKCAPEAFDVNEVCIFAGIGQDIPSKGLIHVAALGRKEILELLLSIEGCDPNLDGSVHFEESQHLCYLTPLVCAISVGAVECVGLLMQHVDLFQQPPLDRHICRGQRAAEKAYSDYWGPCYVITDKATSKRKQVKWR